MSAVIAPSPSSVEEGRLGERRRGFAAGWAALDASGMRTFWLVCATVLVAQFIGLVVYSAYLYRRFDLTDDFATYAQAWWAIGHGHLDPIDTIQTPTYPFWQSHFELAMWPIALIGRVWPHSVQLLWLQDLALVATEWLAMAWVAAICAARSGRARTFVALVALVFLVVNPWWYLAASFDVHFETLGLPFVVLSGYSLWCGRPRTAVVVAAVGVLFGDVVALAVLCVGIAALVSRHARRASGTKAPLAVTLLSAGWVVLATALDANKGSGIVTNYGWLVGATPDASSGWVLGHLALHPFHVVRELFGRIGGIGRVLASAGLVGVVTPFGFFVALGILGPTALNANKAFLSPTIAFQTLAVIPFVFVGSVIVLLRIAWPSRAAPPSPAQDPGEPAERAGTLPWRPVAAGALAVALVTVSLVQSLPLYGTIRTDWWRVDGRSAAVLATAVDRVPSGAEAVVSQGVIGRFAGRTELYPLLAAPQRFPVHARQVDFVIVPSAGIESIPAGEAEQVRASLLEHQRASLVFEADGVSVLSWRPPPGVSSVVLP
ncbi:MAG: hypothetical protein WB565_08380 [Acidimicrobiales bacterium]